MHNISNTSNTLRIGSQVPPAALPVTNALKLANDFTVTFYRTCRVPRSSKVNALPSGLGTFPLYKVSDFSGNVPKDWKPEGHFLPMYPHEAMWMGFQRFAQPVALLVGAGMVNAVSGEKLAVSLSSKPQNYLVVPPQPWLDGFKPTSGQKVYQFVAAQLGSGETAEEQILGTSEFGGIQLGLFRPKIQLIPEPSLHEHILGESQFYYKTVGRGMPGQSLSLAARAFSVNSAAGIDARSMGLGAGGSIKQKIYPDPYLNGRDVSEVWHSEPSEKAYIYIVHAQDFHSITGQNAPDSPIDYKTYKAQGLPWFGLPDGEWGDVEGSGNIDNLKPVSGGPDPTDANAYAPNETTKDLW